MRFVDFIVIKIFALAAANPVSLDPLFSSDVPDLGNSPSTESLFDPLYSEDTMNTNDLFSSAASSDPGDSLLYTDMALGNVATATSSLDTTILDEPSDVLFDQDNYSIGGNDDLSAQFSQGEADNECIPDITTRGIGKMRLGRSCSELKEDKKSAPKTCDKSRSQLCCCSGRGVDGAFNLGCISSTHISFADLSHVSVQSNIYICAFYVEKPCRVLNSLHITARLFSLPVQSQT